MGWRRSRGQVVFICLPSFLICVRCPLVAVMLVYPHQKETLPLSAWHGFKTQVEEVRTKSRERFLVFVIGDITGMSPKR